MPTRHSRIAVTSDPELTQALARTASRLRARTAAGRVRELALHGAEALAGAADPEADAQRALAAGRLTSLGRSFRPPQRRVRLSGSGPDLDALVREGRR